MTSDGDGEVLDQLGEALRAADPAAVLDCFTDDIVLVIPDPSGARTFAGVEEVRGALDTFFGVFSEIGYTAQNRYVTSTQTTEEGTFTGRHTANFADIEATAAPVRVSVRFLAEAAADGRLWHLTVSADIASLRLQLGAEVTAGAAAAAEVHALREQRTDELHVMRASNRKKPAVPSAGRPAHPGWAAHPGRLLAGGLGVAAMAVIAAILLSSGETPTSPTSTLSSPEPTTPPSSASLAPAPASSAAPAIATAQPGTALTVQPGEQLVLASDVLFQFDSATLTPAARSSLRQLADRIKASHVRGTIQINGYTDNLGTTSYDASLSRARALAVAEALQPLLLGEPVTLLPQGFGKADPVAPNSTEPGKARNRRVTIVLPQRR